MKAVTTAILVLLFLTPAAPTVEKLEGIGIGTHIDDAYSKLKQIGTGGGRDTHDGGRKEAWTLRETDFASLAFKSNKAGRIVWVSAFVRPGREVLFTKLGDPAKATTFTNSQAIWNVGSTSGGYRLVAKGTEGKASVVYLLSLDFPEIQ